MKSIDIEKPKRQAMRIYIASLLFCGILVGSHTAQAAPQIAIAAFQALGVQKSLPSILQDLGNAYQQHTGNQALNSLQANLGPLGLKKLGTCAQKIPCLISTTKKGLSSQLQQQLNFALFVGVGSIGQKLLVRYILLDLKAGKALHQVNQSYAGIAALKAALPDQMKIFFPNYASLRVKGTPVGATVFLNNIARGKIPTKTIKASTLKPISLRILAEGYKVHLAKIQLKPGKLMELKVALKKASVSVPRRVVPKPPERRPPPPPITSKGWFWAVVGVGVAAVAGGVVAGVVLSQPPPCEGCIPAAIKIDNSQ